MKLFHTGLLALSVLLLLGGCINENTGNCLDTENNVRLSFRYRDSAGLDVFAGKISRVSAFVYDNSGAFVVRKDVEQPTLLLWAGTELTLSPGAYRVVCWGNTLTHTAFGGVSAMDIHSNSFLYNAAITGGNTVAANGDALYYAPGAGVTPNTFTLTVPPSGTATETIDFCCAHITVRVYVKGLNDKDGAGNDLAPIIELANVDDGYTFAMQPSGAMATYSATSAYRTISPSGDYVACMDFHTPLFDDNNPLEVLIRKGSDNSLLTTIPLKDFMLANTISVAGVQEAVVPVLVEYKSASVEISIPSWGFNPVNPDL